ncbi:hypothetical protein MBLNU457_5145t1 [Dothideomycetes sp. NU457]
MSQAPSRPLAATVEEFDEDRGQSKPETRQSARLTSKQPRRRSEVNQQKHPDVASDSGYSSHTHSTHESADVANAIPAVRAPSPPKVVSLDNTLPTAAIDTSLPAGPQDRVSVPAHINASKESKRRSVQIDPKDVKGTHQVRGSAYGHYYTQTTADECRDPTCDCYRYPATTTPLDRPLNIIQAPFNDLRYSYRQHAYHQLSSSTSPTNESHYPGAAPDYASGSPVRPSLTTRSRPASYHAGYGYTYYPDAHTVSAGLPSSSARNYAQYAHYYQYPPQYSGDSTSAAPYHPLSPVTASPQSTSAYDTRPGLPRPITDTITPRRSTQYPTPITTNGFAPANRPYPMAPLSAGGFTYRDRASRTTGSYFDDRHEQPRRADNARSPMPEDSQMPPPILRRSSTRQNHVSVQTLQPPRDSHRSHSSRSRSRTDAGVTTRTYYRYSDGESTHREDADRSRRDRREPSSHRSPQPSVSTATSGHDRSSTYSSNTGGYIVDDRTGRRNDRRTDRSEDRDRPLYETRRSSQEHTVTQAEDYQARVRGVDIPEVTTERIARARGQSPSSSRPVIPQSNDHHPRSAVSGSSGQKSHRSSKRQSMDGSRISRTDTGDIRIRMDHGTSIRLDDREIRVENNDIIIGRLQTDIIVDLADEEGRKVK